MLRLIDVSRVLLKAGHQCAALHERIHSAQPNGFVKRRHEKKFFVLLLSCKMLMTLKRGAGI